MPRPCETDGQKVEGRQAPLRPLRAQPAPLRGPHPPLRRPGIPRRPALHRHAGLHGPAGTHPGPDQLVRGHRRAALEPEADQRPHHGPLDLSGHGPPPALGAGRPGGDDRHLAGPGPAARSARAPRPARGLRLRHQLLHRLPGRGHRRHGDRDRPGGRAAAGQQLHVGRQGPGQVRGDLWRLLAAGRLRPGRRHGGPYRGGGRGDAGAPAAAGAPGRAPAAVDPGAGVGDRPPPAAGRLAGHRTEPAEGLRVARQPAGGGMHVRLQPGDRIPRHPAAVAHRAGAGVAPHRLLRAQRHRYGSSPPSSAPSRAGC